MRSVNVGGYPIQIMQNAKYLAFLFEQSTWFHIVYIDGRDHPAEVEPTWFGNSIGKFDGDTLTVDTVGFNGKTRLDTIGHPHSDKMHLIQTFQLHRPRSSRVRGHDRRSRDVQQAVEESASLHAHETRRRADRVFL